MLEAKKSRWFENIFAVYNQNLFRRRFNSLKAAGLENLRANDTNLPLLLYGNHSSWWDGLVAFQIARRCALDSFIMMEEKQLKELFLFRKLGAFSVIRDQPRQAVESVNYAARLLKTDASRTLWIFPQGEILPNGVRPIRFFNGVGRIIEKIGECRTAAVAMRYEFGGAFKPDIYIKVSAIETVSSIERGKIKVLTENLAHNLTATLNDLNSDIAINETADYVELLR